MSPSAGSFSSGHHSRNLTYSILGKNLLPRGRVSSFSFLRGACARRLCFAAFHCSQSLQAQALLSVPTNKSVFIEGVELAARRGRVQGECWYSSLPCSSPFAAAFELGPLCMLRTWHSVISFLCCSACTKTIACDCDLATDLSGSGSPEFGLIGAPRCAL